MSNVTGSGSNVWDELESSIAVLIVALEKKKLIARFLLSVDGCLPTDHKLESLLGSVDELSDNLQEKKKSIPNMGWWFDKHNAALNGAASELREVIAQSKTQGE